MMLIEENSVFNAVLIYWDRIWIYNWNKEQFITWFWINRWSTYWSILYLICIFFISKNHNNGSIQKGRWSLLGNSVSSNSSHVLPVQWWRVLPHFHSFRDSSDIRVLAHCFKDQEIKISRGAFKINLHLLYCDIHHPYNSLLVL